MRFPFKWRKTSAALSGLLIVAMLFANIAFAASGAGKDSGYAFSSAKAVEVNVLTGLADDPATDGEEGLLSGLLGTVGGLVNGVVDTVGETVGAVAQVGSDLPLVGDLLDALLPLGAGGIVLEVGITDAAYQGGEGTATGYPLGLQLLGAKKLIPISAAADASTGPVEKSALTLDLLGLVGVRALGVDANVEGTMASSASTTANVDVAGLITVGAVETEDFAGKDENGAMVAGSRFHAADINVAGLVKVVALEAVVSAEANGQPGGAKAEAETLVAKVEVLGETIELNAGAVVDIPGIARIALNDSKTEVDPQGQTAKAQAGVLEITLLEALLNGISVRLGTISAEVQAGPVAPAGPAYELTKTAAQDTVEPGGVIEYKLVYNMNRDVQNAKIVDPLPEGTTFVEASDGGVYDAEANAVVWNVGDKAKGDGGVLTLKVKVNEDVTPGTVIRNVATISADNEDPEDSNPTEVTVGAKAHIPFFIGYPDGNFRPEGNISRAEVATIAARLMGLQDKVNEPVDYADVQNHWAKGYIAAATAAGLMDGRTATEFQPDEPATRAELAAVLVRMHTLNPVDFAKLPGGKATFSDVTKDHPAYNFIETAVELGFLNGYEDGTFQPEKNVARAEVAKMFSRALGRGPLVDGKTTVIQHFPDVSRDHWAFGWVEETAMVGHKGVWNGTGEALEYYIDNVKAW